MTSKELTEQGITALKEGNTKRAHDLLQQAVELDPKNAKAWYFLSRTQTSSEEKRISLEQVLAIMPNNKPAREALENLPPDDVEEIIDFEETEPVSSQRYSSFVPDNMGSIGIGTRPKIGGFELPVAIPDAPAEVEPKTIWEDFVETFKNGVAILRQTPGLYEMEIRRATWWRFWQFAVMVWIIGAVASTIASFIFQTQLASSLNSNPFLTETVPYPNLFSTVFSLVLFIPISGIAIYAGLYASHRFIVTNRGGQASFVSHSYTIILPVLTASLITDVSELIFSLTPLLSSLISLALFVLWIYSLYIAGQGLAIVHGVDKKSGYWTSAVLAIVQTLTSMVLLFLVSPIMLSGTGIF